MPIMRVPLAGNPSDREPDQDKDFRLVNAYVEKQDEQRLDVVKRPGLLKDDDTAVAAGRAIVSFSGNLYAFVGNAIYKNGSALGSTLNTSTGPLGFDIQGGSPQKLWISDGTDLYSLETNDTLTAVSDGDFPASHVIGVVILDTYGVVLDSNGLLHNSSADDLTAWASTDNIEAQIKGDSGVALARHINYLLAFGTDTIEVFYDAANATGSPFSRLEGTPSLIGCAARGSVVNLEKKVFWVATAQGNGAWVAEMDGFTPERISNHAVEQDLEDEGTNISNATAYYIRHGGHAFYVLKLTNKTWVYDTEMKAWHEWTFFNGSTEGNWPIISVCRHNNKIYGLHESTGEIFIFDPDTYQDDSNKIITLGQTNRFDGGVNQNKFCARLEVIGDKQTSGNLSISWSDDDHSTFSTARTVDMSGNNRFLTRLGHFKRRTFKWTHEANTPLRLEAFELNMRRGHYGM